MSIRVLVVDDSPLVRAVLRMVLSHADDITVIGEAGDGLAAERKTKELKPDVITMDVLMPMRGGLDTIDAIMEECPTPIVVVADAQGDTQNLAMEALGHGAMEVFPKPTSGFDESATRELLACIRRSARVRLRAPSMMRRRKLTAPVFPVGQDTMAGRAMIGIVGSTGSPQILRSILSALPATFPFPIAIVQHTAHGFTTALASWLDGGTGLKVRVAQDRDTVEPGQVVIAPDDQHLEIGVAGKIKVHKGAAVEGHRPSGTILLRSIASSFGARSIGVILSGMGRDGADGIASIDAAGGRAVIENPESATVGAMPREAIACARAPIVDGSEALAGHLLRIAGRG